MQRVCFTLQVRPDRLVGYRERHAAVWPDMLRALADTGWQNYSLFLRDDGLLVGYLETENLQAALAGMAATAVNARWQAEMADFFVDLALPPDQAFLRLDEVFHLEGQLAALDVARDQAAAGGPAAAGRPGPRTGVVLTGQIALGTASMSLEPGRDRRRDIATIRAAADAGVRVFDVARVYAPPDDPLYSELLLMDALAGRSDVVVGTKGGHFRDGTGFHVDNSPERLRRDVLDSVRVFGGRGIDLYYLHRADDSTVPIEESVGALAAMRDEGLVRGIGVSNVSPDLLARALAVSRVDAVQNLHGAVSRESATVLAECEHHGIPFFAYSPLRADATLEQHLPRLSRLARERGVSLARLALRALLASSPWVSVVSGATREQTVTDSAAAVDVPWDEALDEAYADDLRDGPAA